MLIFLVSALLSTEGQPSCSLQHIEACGGTAELVSSPGFDGALRRFVGPGRASWYEPRSRRAQQLLDVLGGPSTVPVPVGSDLLRFDACYPHVCNIRATLFVTRGGEIQGAALLYPDCSGRTCRGGEGLRLTVLRDPAHPGVATLARQWADADVAARNASFREIAPDALVRTETVNVPGGRRQRGR